MIQVAIAAKVAALGAEAVAIVCLGTALIIAKEEGVKIPEEVLELIRRWSEFEA